MPIATFQAIAHPLADRYIGVVGARRLVWQAAWFAEHEPDSVPAPRADGIRVRGPGRDRDGDHRSHTQGGLGFTVESDMQLYFRRAKGWANVLGDPSRQLQDIADELYGPTLPN